MTTAFLLTLQVFWPKDNIWYKGTVGEFDSLDGSHTIAYDDGIVEVLNLEEEEYRLVEAGATKRKLIVDEEDDIQPNKRRSVKKKSNRRISVFMLSVLSVVFTPSR